MARIKDVAEFVLDGTHGSPVRTEAGIPVLSAQNVKGGRLHFETHRYTSVAEYEDFSRRLSIEMGDVLLTIVGTIGRAAVVEDVRPLVFQRSVAVIRPNQAKLSPRFFYHATQSGEFQSQLARSSNQSSQAGVYLGRLKELRIPLPPLSEQRRIAEVLDRAEALRAKRRAALAELDTLTQSIFLEMFGDPVTNPKRWPRMRVGEIAKVITGNTPPREVPGYYGTAIEWIKSDNVNTPHYYLTKAVEGLSESGLAVARTAPLGSILITCIAGSPECIGNSAMADRAVAFNQQINALVPNVGDAHFLYAQIRVGKRLIQAATTGGMKGMVSKGRLEQVALIFPPVELQRELAARLSAVAGCRSRQAASLSELDELFASVQHRAFRGEL